MSEINDIISADADPPERRPFDATEMVACSGCSRANPPTRSSCLYCGVRLELTERNVHAQTPHAAPETRPENHVIALPSDIDEAALTKATMLLDVTALELNGILRSAKGAPVFSTADPARADIVSGGLRDLGIETITISDDKLDLANAPKDLRTLDITEDSLIGFCRRGGERVAVTWDALTLIVLGRLHITTVEIEQKGKGGLCRLLNERELSVDESVLDLYFRDDESGWRIRSGSFDFSCLGDRKAITAFQNFNVLIDLLRQRAINADFDDAHVRLKSVLAKIWPAQEHAHRTEKRRTATRSFEAKVTSSDNEAQFNRFSRLLSVMRRRQSGDLG